MKVVRGCTAHALLTLLNAKSEPIEHDDMLTVAHAVARSNNTANNALWRLMNAGLVVLEYRITPEGAKALQEAMQR
jgi:predicted transcriptional regulator